MTYFCLFIQLTSLSLSGHSSNVAIFLSSNILLGGNIGC